MIGGMQGFEARDGHAERDEAIEKRVRAECAADIAESDAVRDRLATLLAETAVALKGEEEALTRHSWHDLPVIALEKMVVIENQAALIEQLAGALEADWIGTDTLNNLLKAAEEWRKNHPL